jgi:ubiquitin carboxyl-terminal hydrolase 4/11/15
MDPLKQADELAAAEDWEVALRAYTTAINASPSAVAYLSRGKVYAELNCVAEAIQDLTTSIDLSTSLTGIFYETADALCLRASLYKKQGQLAAASADYKRVSRIYPKAPCSQLCGASYDSLKIELSHRVTEASAEAERTQFDSLMQLHSSVQPNSTWHVVSLSWFKSWERHVGHAEEAEVEEDLLNSTHDLGTSRFPGPIDNTDLVDFKQDRLFTKDSAAPHLNYVLKANLVESASYILLPDAVFQLLKTVYGCLLDIQRVTIEVNDTMFQVEVYLKQLKLCLNHDELVETWITCSRKDTIASVRLRLGQTTSRIWKVNLVLLPFDRLKTILGAKSKAFLEGAILLEDIWQVDDIEAGGKDLLLVETAVDGTYLLSNDPKSGQDQCAYCQKRITTPKVCHICNKTAYCSALCERQHYKTHRLVCKPIAKKTSGFAKCLPCRQSAQTADDEADLVLVTRTPTSSSKYGCTGLENLGNTCFMNSALQCMSRASELTNYFLDNSFMSVLNAKNTSSTQGRLARVYADLIKDLWYGQAKVVTPWKFKKVLEDYAPQFLGYQQHDSQELLGYLLDGLHEDLNRIIKRKYGADPEVIGSDLERATAAWQRHVERNSSVVVEMFHGQFRSAVECPTCLYTSVTFDPFNMLSLPIPQSPTKPQLFYFIGSGAEDIPLSMAWGAGQASTLGHLKSYIAYKRQVPEERVVFATIAFEVLREWNIEDSRPLNSIGRMALFAFEAPEGAGDHIIVELQLTRDKPTKQFISFPRLVFMDPSSTLQALHFAVFEKIRFCMDKSIEGDNRAVFQREIMGQHSPYDLLYVNFNGAFTDCSFCGTNCKNCAVPFSDRLVSEVAATTKRFAVELRWKYSSIKGRANLGVVSRCREDVSVKATQRTTTVPVSIAECFQAFYLPEQLERDNAWMCPKCKLKVEAHKTFEIYRLPKTLIIHLKRFKVVGHSRQKLSTPVVYPMKGLDLSQFSKVGGSCLYDLFAVTNHMGNLTGGHNTAITYDDRKQEWLEYSDSTIVKVEEAAVVSENAYVLFYRRRESSP